MADFTIRRLCLGFGVVIMTVSIIGDADPADARHAVHAVVAAMPAAMSAGLRPAVHRVRGRRHRAPADDASWVTAMDEVHSIEKTVSGPSLTDWARRMVVDDHSTVRLRFPSANCCRSSGFERVPAIAGGIGRSMVSTPATSRSLPHRTQYTAPMPFVLAGGGPGGKPSAADAPPAKTAGAVAVIEPMGVVGGPEKDGAGARRDPKPQSTMTSAGDQGQTTSDSGADSGGGGSGKSARPVIVSTGGNAPGSLPIVSTGGPLPGATPLLLISSGGSGVEPINRSQNTPDQGATSVPEPGGLSLLATAMILLGLIGRRRH